MCFGQCDHTIIRLMIYHNLIIKSLDFHLSRGKQLNFNQIKITLEIRNLQSVLLKQ